jgi:hypothetical protein
MKLYRITIEADVYADEDWDSIKDKLLVAYKTTDGEVVTERPGKYEAIKIIEIKNDEVK